MNTYKSLTLIIFVGALTTGITMAQNNWQNEDKIDQIIQQMTLQEKIGQMIMRQTAGENEDIVRKGMLGSILNESNPETINKIQQIAKDESRLGIPVLFARDVIHGFRTIFPIPLGLAATWNPELIQQGARIAAVEATSVGIRWTFAPMMDISHDPRWGRIAECFGEDPYLTSVFSVAMINGYQTDDPSRTDAMAACAKHFAGYGAAEGGRDYNSVFLPEQLLRDVYLKPFQASVDAGVFSIMPAFNDLNGIPASGNIFLLQKILRQEWGFSGLVVSDWAAIPQMLPHGYSANEIDAAEQAFLAGIDMEMASDYYKNNLTQLLESGKINMELIDQAVRHILRIKFALGLFENPITDGSKFPKMANKEHLAMAKKTALQSIVLLKNENKILPLKRDLKNIAVFGPLADDQFEQLGTWTFDKNIDDTQTPLMALKSYLGPDVNLNYLKTLETSRSKKQDKFDKALEITRKSDVVLLFMGEEAIITGEAHSRANIDLPGAQEKLIEHLAQAGKPIILTVMAGRPLTMGNILDKVDALLFSFHPGTMGGPAITDIVFGVESPSGKLPVTFPKVVGQIPIYYNKKNTGRPANPEHFVHIDDIPVRAFQTSLGNESHYLDAGFKPQYPFGFGLSYSTFSYSDLVLSSQQITTEQELTVTARITNSGNVEADEIVQLYIRDLAASITRPVRELKGFRRIRLKAGESRQVKFVLNQSDLAFYNPNMEFVTEPGNFHVWVAGDSDSGLQGEFELID